MEHGCYTVITGDGVLPVCYEKTRTQYRRVLTHVRSGLKPLCGYKPKEAAAFGVQSLRRGGDTFLWKNGVPQEIRQAIGGWKTPSVELRYLETLIAEQKAFSLKLWAPRRLRIAAQNIKHED